MGVISEKHLDAARQAGACTIDYQPGDSIENVAQEDLIWFAINCRGLAAEVEARAGVPLWTLSGYGYGDGFGSGDGSGSSYGYGYGSGSGAGYGDGYGYGE